MRPLPQPSIRPAATGPAFYVDTAKGQDTNAGTVDAPFKTIAHGLRHLKPGDTLNLRGGIYRENVYVARIGQKDKPITIRSHPNELAIIDPGYAEFLDSPQTAWEPADAAKALVDHSDLTAPQIVENALKIAGQICIYTNTSVKVETL